MKTIKIKFTGFWKNFNENDNFILDILKKNYEVVLSETPEYLFYSVFNDDYIKYDCVRIFVTGENICPDFQMCDYAIGFERMEFEDRYLRCPFYFVMKEYREDLDAALKKHLNAEMTLAGKTEFCSFVYSNADADEMRTEIFRAVNQYKNINAGGKVFNTYQGKRVDSKREFERKHKFSIACENSRHNGYITEKIMQAFAAGTIPIYWGAADITRDYNERAFINVTDFPSLEELVAYIKRVDEDDELYLKYLSESAFSEKIQPEKMQEKLEQFITHIMEQPVEVAYRRNRVFWGKSYQRRYWVYKRAHGFLMKLQKITGRKVIEKIEGGMYE